MNKDLKVIKDFKDLNALEGRKAPKNLDPPKLTLGPGLSTTMMLTV